MNNKIKEIIDEWDPVDLFPFAPEDEYKAEIAEIAMILNQDVNVETLAVKIKEVFIESFGMDMFFQDDESVLEVAKKLKNANSSNF